MKTLFEQTTLGSLSLKNRLWRSATWLNMADSKGHITKRLWDKYTDLAKGGVGTIIPGYAFIMEEEQPNPGMLGIYDDSFIDEYRPFVKSLQEHGTKVILQIVYGGSATNFNLGSRTIWGPSAVAHPAYGTVPTEMTRENIKTVQKAFVAAAKRVKAAGFDGVQLHGAHTYLLSQFLSPYYNRREDEFGGSIENRGRIIFEIVDAVRAEVGVDYPVLIKMHCSDDWGEHGLTVEESLFVAKELEKRGITAIEFSGGNLDNARAPGMSPIRKGLIKKEKQSYFAQYVATIKAQLNIPVILVGGNRSPQRMEELLNTNNIDYFSLSRTLHAEPDLVNKWQKERLTQPRCTSCAQCWHQDGNICILDRNEK